MKLETRLSRGFSSLFLDFGIPLTKKHFRVSSLLYDKPTAWVTGYTNRTQQGKYVLFQDYDDLEIEDIIEELKFLQEKYSLSDYYIFKLGKTSFHAVCLDCFSLYENFRILKESSCDSAFVNSVKRLKTREWVLRLTGKGERPKPVFLTIIKSKYCNRVKSSGHANVLKKMNCFIRQRGKWDNCDGINLIEYTTANRIKKGKA